MTALTYSPPAQTMAPDDWIDIPISGHSVRIIPLSPGDAIHAHRSAWQQLADTALEPNAFAEPFALMPALFAFASPDVTLALAYLETDLIGVFCVERRSRFRGLPVPSLIGWTHPHMYLAAPLLSPEVPDIAWTAFLLWARRTGAIVIEWPLLPNGPTQDALQTALKNVNAAHHCQETFARMVLDSDGRNSETFLRETCSAKSRKSWRRQMRRLGEQGALETRVLDATEDPKPWIDAFLALESSGWKGQDGTALASSGESSAFFHDLCHLGHQRGQLSMLGLFLDDIPIAMQCNLVRGSKGFAVKVAFDESWARYSPGVLLEVEAIRHYLDQTDLRWMDSCTGASASVMSRLWNSQTKISSWLFSPGGLARNTALHSLVAAKRAKQLLRAGS